MVAYNYSSATWLPIGPGPVPDKPMTGGMKPYCCPVCHGRRTVPNCFYGQTPGTAEQPCKSCTGTGIVWAWHSGLRTHSLSSEVILELNRPSWAVVLTAHTRDYTLTLLLSTTPPTRKMSAPLRLWNCRQVSLGGLLSIDLWTAAGLSGYLLGG